MFKHVCFSGIVSHQFEGIERIALGLKTRVFHKSNTTAWIILIALVNHTIIDRFVDLNLMEPWQHIDELIPNPLADVLRG